MTEKEKMLAHQMYDANYNEELHDERIAACGVIFIAEESPLIA